MKGCVGDWSMKEMTGLNDEQVTKLLTELENSLPKDVNNTLLTGHTKGTISVHGLKCR